ncbi:MAG: ribosome-associated translation inhibitor RaiA [Candidatus Aminicenantes bacterium]|nr:MAG: ribosome-associated translation inhibitor RaiA [Candidatus Aminicenantes bacterium]
MNINFTAQHANITPEMKKYCERRMKSLEKLFGYRIDANVILSVEKYRHKAEINIKTRKTTLNAVEETQDMQSSLGLAFDNIEKRAKKERDKLREKKRRKRGEKEIFSIPIEPEERQKQVIRSQDYSLKPMSIEEAIIQFDLDKKEVFVFRKSGSEKWAVVYRRKDGNYGLVEPE